MSSFGFGISGLYKSEPTFFFVFGCLYRERYFCSYSLRSFFMFRFGFGISGLYKSEPTFFFVFGSLYRERYFCSYSLISFCFVLRFALKCGLRVSLPRATSCCVQDVDFFTPDFGCLYRERYFCSYSFRSFFDVYFWFWYFRFV